MLTARMLSGGSGTGSNKEEAMRKLSAMLWVPVLLAGCGRGEAPQGATTAASATAAAPLQPAGTSQAAVAAEQAAPEFPAIPTIVVPEIVGVTAAQRVLEASLQDILDPIEGVSVAPARCGDGGTLITDAGITSVDANGNLVRNCEGGLFDLEADGSGTANFEGGLVNVNADGSGTINATGDGGSGGALIDVQSDGGGTYNGPAGLISLDGKGAGTWNSEKSGLVDNRGDGSGTWNGPRGLVTINADGSGTWNGPDGLVQNHGDGTGTVGTPPREVRMPPLPKVPPAGRFPPLQKFAPPGAPCGYLITLNDRILFDFDKSDIRPDAARVLDTLSAALSKVTATDMQVRGHTDAKGSDDYNQALSERRANAVLAALRARGAAQSANAKGYGESQPVAPNTVNGQDNPGGRQLNRRVEIFLRT
ncbi:MULTISPECIES: OmpA family protein [Xanthomonas]|uniref:OmpA family protein n=1 Tax=Xanthomonas TaxID=338 RepID=UPI001AD95251|nr:OmpA family protein [Xanthomonas phaseoli]MBO9767319.1 OmpA family protein [Xanthomonas phaseoli pv. dieffenbachiae]MBO9774965.1 OmpA family protein [Xanthomonas phaseoli pv. dieffenbachiae]MBO9779275.1 OmpA family protein [Xanthomonas phaseoli pv. dieffenbachiae]MBO9795601.1 OmpA family protein [Xanthomonas phaseoli pv. dieffenbachiae]MBO9799523.1 OmpA family protein [Xanthomonas phaseoli pv. dieffenbachiae]